MVDVTMEQVIAFRNTANIFNNYKLPLKIAYKMNKLRKAVDAEGEFYGNKFQEIVDTYAQHDDKGQVVFSEDGEQILIKDGMVEECNKALADLQSLTVSIDNCNLTVDDFGDDIECTPEELEALMPFLG